MNVLWIKLNLCMAIEVIRYTLKHSGILQRVSLLFHFEFKILKKRVVLCFSNLIFAEKWLRKRYNKLRYISNVFTIIMYKLNSIFQDY